MYNFTLTIKLNNIFPIKLININFKANFFFLFRIKNSFIINTYSFNFK